MRWGLWIGVLALLFFLEGTVMQVFSLFTARFVLVILILLSLHADIKKTFILGIVFGALYDLLYSDLVGVYAFSMALIPYLCAWVNRYFQLNILLAVLTTFIGVYLHETLVYLLFALFGLTGDVYIWFEYLPAALANTIFAVLVYRLTYDKLELMTDRRQEDGSR
jgi:rod shape-determining protein MreD